MKKTKNTKKAGSTAMLTDLQTSVVKDMIVSSMRGAYIDSGTLPNSGFDIVSGQIADSIIKNAQMTLMQKETFAECVEESGETKKKKVTKK